MTAQAKTTARQVKTTSSPKPCCKKEPKGPWRPKRRSKTSPVATGGTNNGSISTVSTTAFPGQSRRAINQAIPIPSGKISSVLRADIPIVKTTICHASPVMTRRLWPHHEAEFLEDRPRFGTCEILGEFLGAFGFPGRFQDRDRIGNFRPFGRRDFDRTLHFF